MSTIRLSGVYCRLVASFIVIILNTAFVTQSHGQQSGNSELSPLSFGILLSSDANGCYDSSTFKAARYFASQAINAINQSGGILGRQVKLKIFDDRGDAEKTLDLIRAAVGEPGLIGLAGLDSSTRGKYVFDRIGEEIGASNIPIVSNISLSQIYAPYENVFSMASAVADELDVVRAFLQDKGITRPAFIGINDNIYSSALGDGLAKPDSQPALALDRRVTIANYSIDPAEAARIVNEIQKDGTDLIILAVQSGPGAQILKQLVKAGIKVPIFVLYGRVARILNMSRNLPKDMQFYELARDGVPYVYNERLRKVIWNSPPQSQWIFEDTPNKKNKTGWAKGGHCKITHRTYRRQILDSANIRAIGYGMRYRDILSLMGTIAQTATQVSDAQAIRKYVARELGRYVEGQLVYQGLWQDWTFTQNRAMTKDVLITTFSTDPKSAALAPMQYLRVNASLTKSPVVDISIDLVRLDRIDSNERQFDAEFYLSLRSADNSIAMTELDFTNTARSQFGADRLIVWHEIHDGGKGSKFSEGVKVYKISGTFQFVPELGYYPFDTQRLSISFQTKNAALPFLVQPSPENLRHNSGRLDGWSLMEQYVGSEQDIISTITGHAEGRRIVPIYKFNQTWVAERISTDYYIRVIVPLGFILLVTYFSVFLQQQRFDSTIAVQVTALLSSIALYLALPKVETDQATLSDNMFILTYAAITMMIGLTILKDSRFIAAHNALHWSLAGFQRVAFPLIIVAILSYLITTAGGKSSSITRKITELWSF